MKRFIILLLTAVMVLSPAAVFADTGSDDAAVRSTNDESRIYTDWGENRDCIYDSNHEKVTGFFKAPTIEDPNFISLYYADQQGNVRKDTGFFEVPAGEDKFSYDTTKHGWTLDDSLKDSAVSYYIPSRSDGDFYLEEKSGIVSGYFIRDNGTVRTEAGLFKFGGKTYCTASGGALITTVGFIKSGGSLYYIQDKTGAIRTKTGIMTVGSYKYLVQSGGAIRTTKGLCKYSGKYYYVKNTKGVLYVNKKIKAGSKIYHAGTKGAILIGPHKWGKYYYYSGKKGVVRVKAGIVKYSGKYYYVAKKGKIATNKKFKYRKKSYISNKKGVIYTGFFTWKKGLYYSTSKGVLRTKRGFFSKGGFRYYVGPGAKIYKNKSFKVGGKTYRAASDGSLYTGYYLWNKKYYYADSKGALRTAEGLFYDSANKKYYYNKRGGGLMTDSFVEYKGKYYYTGSGGAVKTSKFTYTYKGKKYTITPDKKTGEVSKEDYVRIFGDVDDDDEEV